MTKISIILYTFNAVSSIENIIIGLRNQSLSDFECIIIDGGSTDKTCAIIQSYAILDNRFKLHILNFASKSKAYNIGLEMQNSEYCMFWDSFEIPSHDCLERLYSFAKTYEGDIVRYSKSTENIYIQNSLQIFVDILRNGNEHPLLWHIIKSTIASKIIFKDYMQYEDRLFLLECVSASQKIISIDCNSMRNREKIHIPYKQVGKGEYILSSLDALLHIMNFVQTNFNKGLHIYALQHTMVETLNLVDELDNHKSKSQRKAIEYAKKISKVYLKWFVLSREICLTTKLKSIILSISFRLYKNTESLSEFAKSLVSRKYTYISSKNKRLDSDSKRAYIKEIKSKESDRR